MCVYPSTKNNSFVWLSNSMCMCVGGAVRRAAIIRFSGRRAISAEFIGKDGAAIGGAFGGRGIAVREAVREAGR